LAEQHDDVIQRIASLESDHSARAAKRREWKALRRGLDPRFITNRELQNQDKNPRLRTNDSVTYFDLVVHMLSGRAVRWQLPSRAGDSPETQKDYSNAEYLVAGILRQNNERLLQKGTQRMERAFADSVCETGVIVYSLASLEREGTVQFKIEPVNPANVFERFDDDGLSEITHVFPMGKTNFLRWVAREPIADAGIVDKIKNSNARVVTVKDYYERDFGTNDEVLIRRGIVVDSEVLREVSDDIRHDVMPFNVLYSNGEAFPNNILRGDSISSGTAKSILDANGRIYTDINDFLEKLDLHMDEVLTAPVDELTHGGRPVADPYDLDARSGERVTQPYDASRGERGRQIINIPALDQSTNIIVTTLEGMRQRGSVSDLLHGNLNVALSGFAIAQVLEAALATSAESRVVMQLAYDDIGKWIIDTFRDKETGFITIGVDPADSGQREFFYEEVKPEDMPAHSLIKSTIELATPSDLTERVNNARTLDPSGGPVVSRRSIWEHIIPDLVPDAAREAEDLNEQRLELLPEVQQLEMIQGLISRIAKAEIDGDTEEQQILETILEEFRQLLQPNPQQQPQGVAAGIPPTNVLPTAQRTRGSAQPGAVNNL